MGRPAKTQFSLPDGRVVGCGFKIRNGIVRIQFPHPTQPGKYSELSTGIAVPKGFDSKKKNYPNDAYTEAAKLILKAYVPTIKTNVKNATWDTVLDELEKTSTLKPTTIHDYRTITNSLRSLLPETKGPSEITSELATRFKRLYSSTGFKKSKASDAKVYARKPKTIENALDKLSSLWSVHLRELGYVNSNPWENIARPDVPTKVVTIPEEDHFAHCFQWLQKRYPEWELLDLFVSVKALAGCRTDDLCNALSVDLKDGKLTLSKTKTKVPRTIPLPDDLYSRLQAIKGKTFLWERYTEDARKFRPGKRNKQSFGPRTLYWCINNVFREYNEANPSKKVKPHDLRKRAITLTTLATQSVDLTAEAIGIDPQTARRYYNDASKSFRGEELLKQMSNILRPKNSALESPQNPESESQK
jgi:integrase